MINLIALLLAMQASVTVPPPPSGVGPYQRYVEPPPPLVLSEVEQAMWNAFGALRVVQFITCDSPDVRARIMAAGQRFREINPRLARAVDRARGGRIVMDSISHVQHATTRGCPPPEAVGLRLSALERSIDALGAALRGAGH